MTSLALTRFILHSRNFYCLLQNISGYCTCFLLGVSFLLFPLHHSVYSYFRDLKVKQSWSSVSEMKCPEDNGPDFLLVRACLHSSQKLPVVRISRLVPQSCLILFILCNRNTCMVCPRSRESFFALFLKNYIKKSIQDLFFSSPTCGPIKSKTLWADSMSVAPLFCPDTRNRILETESSIVPLFTEDMLLYIFGSSQGHDVMSPTSWMFSMMF